jgi:hypothetical protein
MAHQEEKEQEDTQVMSPTASEQSSVFVISFLVLI